jgi:hypothetical protein
MAGKLLWIIVQGKEKYLTSTGTSSKIMTVIFFLKHSGNTQYICYTICVCMCVYIHGIYIYIYTHTYGISIHTYIDRYIDIDIGIDMVGL